MSPYHFSYCGYCISYPHWISWSRLFWFLWPQIGIFLELAVCRLVASTLWRDTSTVRWTIVPCASCVVLDGAARASSLTFGLLRRRLSGRPTTPPTLTAPPRAARSPVVRATPGAADAMTSWTRWAPPVRSLRCRGRPTRTLAARRADASAAKEGTRPLHRAGLCIVICGFLEVESYNLF